MMTAEYFQYVYKRTNLIKEGLFRFFLAISSWPRLLIEVFVRSNFGERYFSLASAVTVLIVMGTIPYLIEYGWALFSSYARDYHRFYWGDFLAENLTWYIFLAGYAYMSFKRFQEVISLPSVYELKRFSLSTGLYHPYFTSFQFGGKRVSARIISTVLEPGLFFFIGLVLWVMNQNIGTALMICSVIYSFSYQAAYYLADTYVMDTLDKIIASEEMGNVLKGESDTTKPRGFEFLSRRPASADGRRRMAALFEEDEETAVAV